MNDFRTISISDQMEHIRRGVVEVIREEELVRSSGPRLSGKRVIIDPGRGGSNHGMIMHGPDGPISETNSPGWMVSDTSTTASTCLRVPALNTFPTPTASTAAWATPPLVVGALSSSVLTLPPRGDCG